MIPVAIVTGITTAILNRLIQTPSVPVSRDNSVVVRPEVQEAVKEALTKDPVIVNELNAEKPVQSRVLWGNAIAGIGTVVAGIVPILSMFGVITEAEGNTIVQGTGAIIALGGVCYSVYGRLASGLKPLFSKR